MNLALIDPFQLAQDYPDALTNDLRKSQIQKRGVTLPICCAGCGHATTLRFNRKGDYLASGTVDGKVIIWVGNTCFFESFFEIGLGLQNSGHGNNECGHEAARTL